MPAHQDLLNQARPYCDPANGEVVQRLPDELMQQLRAAKLARGIPGCRSHHTQTRATWYVFLTDQIRDSVLLESQEAKQKAKRERRAVVVPVEYSVESPPTGGDPSASRPLAQRGLGQFRQTRRQAK